MIAVIFESQPRPGKKDAYLGAAASLRPQLEAHSRIQASSRQSIFAGYRLRVAQVVRDYGMNDRDQVPEDSWRAR